MPKPSKTITARKATGVPDILEVFGANILSFNKFKQQREDIQLQEFNQKENEKKFETALATLILMREALVIRTATLRAYNFHTEHYEEPEEIERDESVLAIVSLFYLFSAALSAYLYNKELPITQKNKLLYDVIDTITWSAISIMRLPGHFFSELDASEWEGMSTMMFDGFVLGCYGIELINQLRYDIAQYQHYKKLLESDPDNPHYQYEVAKCQLAIGADSIHLSSMIIGVSLNMVGVMSAGTPVGLLLMVSATIGNQLKNVVVAFADLNHAIKKCERKLQPLNEELARLNMELASKENPPDTNIVNDIKTKIANIETQITTVKKENMKDIRKAQKKFVFEMAKLSIIFISVGLLALGGPVGAMAFAIGVAGYLLTKGGFLAYEKYEAYQEKNAALVTNSYNSQNQTPSQASSNKNQQNGSPTTTPPESPETSRKSI